MFSKVDSDVGAPAVAVSKASAVFFALGIALASGIVCAADDADTTTIKRDVNTEKMTGMAEPSYQTREARLKAQPLDWNSTIGKPKRKVLSPAEKNALQKAKPESTEGGSPDPKANEDARKLHPDDWKMMDQAPR
jgi:hypothetical protein